MQVGIEIVILQKQKLIPPTGPAHHRHAKKGAWPQIPRRLGFLAAHLIAHGAGGFAGRLARSRTFAAISGIICLSYSGLDDGDDMFIHE